MQPQEPNPYRLFNGADNRQRAALAGEAGAPNEYDINPAALAGEAGADEHRYHIQRPGQDEDAHYQYWSAVYAMLDEVKKEIEKINSRPQQEIIVMSIIFMLLSSTIFIPVALTAPYIVTTIMLACILALPLIAIAIAIAIKFKKVNMPQDHQIIEAIERELVIAEAAIAPNEERPLINLSNIVNKVVQQFIEHADNRLAENPAANHPMPAAHNQQNAAQNQREIPMAAAAA